MLLLRTLALAAAGTAAAGTTTIAFGPPVTIGHAGNIATSEQFPSGALAAIQYAGEHGGVARVLARGTTVSAAWRVQNVSKMAVREPQCAVDPAACPGVCNVKTTPSQPSHSKCRPGARGRAATMRARQRWPAKNSAFEAWNAVNTVRFFNLGTVQSVAAHPRKPLVPETKGLRGRAATD